MTTFETMADAISYVEEALGEYASDFDVDAIASEVTDWQDGKLTLIADGDEFWEIAAKHDASKTYMVIIGDEREEVADVMLEENFGTLEEAQERFDELKDSFDFYEHDEMWLMESLGNDSWGSIDRHAR